jgi:hypothetical protein
MERVNSYLTRAELTQCAHRSRALRQARTVVTFCLDTIDYLPATETVNDLPQLTPEGRERWTASRQAEREKIQTACHLLEEEGRTIHMLTVRELKAAAQVSTDAAAEHLRQARKLAQQERDQAGNTHTHTHTICVLSPVPEGASNNLNSKVGYSSESQQAAPGDPPPDIETDILDYGRAHSYPALDAGDVHIAPGPQAWKRFIWLAGPTPAERQAVYNHCYPQPGNAEAAG